MQKMTRAQAEEHLMQTRLKDYLRDYRSFTERELRGNIQCLNPEHADNNPSMGYHVDKTDKGPHERLRCFGCDTTYDLFDLIGQDYELADYNDQFNKACELFEIQLVGRESTSPLNRSIQKPQAEWENEPAPEEKRKVQAYIEECHRRVNQTDYFAKRGIGQALIDRFQLGYDPNFKGWDAVILPTGEASYTARNTDGNADKGNRIRKQGRSVLFNQGALWSGKPVFITEGEFDALSVMEAGAEAVALGSTENASKLIEAVKKNKSAHWLILALDNDDAGTKAASHLAAELKSLGVPFLIKDIAGSMAKDPNQSLTLAREPFLQAVKDAETNAYEQERAIQEELRQAYLQTSAASYINDFIDGIKERANTPYIETGFPVLDEMLDGGLHEGLYVIGAISSLGKTTFTLQIADQIAKSERPVLIFSLEMSRHELMAKSISRLTFELAEDKRKAKTTRGITTLKKYKFYDETERKLINQAIVAYRDYAGQIFIHEGIGDIGVTQVRNAVERHMSMMDDPEKKPVIIIDYLQIIAPYDPRSTDKQNTDRAVLELKRMSRDLKIPILAISSFNRQNYKEKVSFEAFKESGAVEYSSDVLIGLQAKGAGAKEFDVDAAKAKDPREIELKILKNRNGRTGATIEYAYYPKFNHFDEIREVK